MENSVPFVSRASRSVILHTSDALARPPTTRSLVVLDEEIVARNVAMSTSFYRRSIVGIDRSRTPGKERPRRDSTSNRDFRLILQTRRYACVIDCPRSAEPRERTRIRGCVGERRRRRRITAVGEGGGRGGSNQGRRDCGVKGEREEMERRGEDAGR